MRNDESRTINHFDNASKRKDFKKWSTILRWDENVTKHKKIEGIVCKEQYVPSTPEMLQSLIPKMPNACSNNFCKMIPPKPYKSLLKTKDFNLWEGFLNKPESINECINSNLEKLRGKTPKNTSLPLSSRPSCVHRATKTQDL